MAIFSWRTHKKKKGFDYEVKQITPRNTPTKSGMYATTKTIKAGNLPTRARAKKQAQRWVRYYNARRK
jgi:hypothetical protein